MTPTGACSRGFQWGPVSWLLDSVATAWGLFHNLDSRLLWGLHRRHFKRSTDMCLFSFLNTGQLWLGGANLFVSVRVGVLLKRSCHRTLLWCEAGNGKQLPIAYGRYNGPVRVMQKHRHECIISSRSQVGRHGLYPGHYSGIFVAPKNARNAETKHQSGVYPILLLALSASMTSAYTSLGVSPDSNPQTQLLKASVYHSATSAVWIQYLKKILWEFVLWPLVFFSRIFSWASYFQWKIFLLKKEQIYFKSIRYL